MCARVAVSDYLCDFQGHVTAIKRARHHIEHAVLPLMARKFTAMGEHEQKWMERLRSHDLRTRRLVPTLSSQQSVLLILNDGDILRL